jgi:hypothetical protein
MKLETRATTSPGEQKPLLSSWPQWMQQALAHELETGRPQAVARVDEPARDNPASIRILSRAK